MYPTVYTIIDITSFTITPNRDDFLQRKNLVGAGSSYYFRATIDGALSAIEHPITFYYVDRCRDWVLNQ